MNSIFDKYLDKNQQVKVYNIATKLGISPDWLGFVMLFESGLNPKAKNPKGSAVGLIQFVADYGKNYKTLGGKQYLMTEIANMDFYKQMDLVYTYLFPFRAKITSFTNCYLAVFFPAALDFSDTSVLSTKTLSAQRIAQDNAIFDTNKDLKLTKNEVTNYFVNHFKKLFPNLDTNLITKKKI